MGAHTFRPLPLPCSIEKNETVELREERKRFDSGIRCDEDCCVQASKAVLLPRRTIQIREYLLYALSRLTTLRTTILQTASLLHCDLRSSYFVPEGIR